jgi:hypothetical protein
LCLTEALNVFVLSSSLVIVILYLWLVTWLIPQCICARAHGTSFCTCFPFSYANNYSKLELSKTRDEPAYPSFLYLAHSSWQLLVCRVYFLYSNWTKDRKREQLQITRRLFRKAQSKKSRERAHSDRFKS